MLLLKPWAGALLISCLVVLVVTIHVWIPYRRGREDLLTALRARRLAGPRYWIPAAVVLTPVWAVAAGFVYARLFTISETPPDLFFQYAEHQGGWLAVAIFTVVFGPIVEEFAFRGWIQGALERRLSPLAAIMVAAFLYAIVHGNADGLLILFCIGALFGWAAWQSGSVWAGVLLHSSYNASLLGAEALQERGIGSFRLVRAEEFSTFGVIALSVLAALALAGVIHLGRHAGRAPDSPPVEPSPDGPAP
jgi:membrane protease YdiL (CAAX protease family)